MPTKTRKPARTWNDNEFEQGLDQILGKTVASFKERTMKVYNLLTEDEKAKLSTGHSVMTGQDEQFPERLAKAILLAIGEESLKCDWMAETLRSKVSSVKRITGRRPH